jgi:hypothetical protein
MKKGFLLLFAAILLAGMVLASADNTKAPELGARYDYLACRADLVRSQSEILAGYGNFSIDKLATDLAQVKIASDTGDTKAFADDLNVLFDDFKTVNNELTVARKSYAKSNLTTDQRNSLRTSWNATLADYQSCNVAARKQIVTQREQRLQDEINKWNEVIANMTARGLDTTELNGVLADAQNLLSRLENASQATDDNNFRSILNEANNQHLHIWARFAIGRIRAHVEKESPFAEEGNRTGDVDQINSLLNSASSMAASGRKYNSGEFEKTWENIKDASQQTNALSKDLRDIMRNERQIKRNDTFPRNYTKGNFTMENTIRNMTKLRENRPVGKPDTVENNQGGQQ